MGIIHKLRPEIIEFIVQQKKSNPGLSCRGLTSLINVKFQIKVSKSSVNEIIKEAGFSQPVGRSFSKTPQTLKERIHLTLNPEAMSQSTGEILGPSLRAAEGSKTIPAEIVLSFDKSSGRSPERSRRASSPATEGGEAPPEKERDCPGLILLKAMDYLAGGSNKFNELIQAQLGANGREVASFNEGLIYYSLLEKTEKGFDLLRAVLGVDIAENRFKDYFARLKEANALKVELSGALADIFKEVRCLRIIFNDGNFLFLDASFYTTWSTQYTPYNFSAGVNKVKSDLNKYFQSSHPLILFMAPGYDFPAKEFMGLILNFEKNAPHTIKLYDNKLAEISTIRFDSGKNKHHLVFGLWPWQFTGARSVKSLGEFKPYHLKNPDNDYLLADIQLELLHPESKQKVLLSGCALKNSPAEQTKLVILTDALKGEVKLDELADRYLSNWPNKEETFQDYSRKVELFTYTADSQKFFSSDILNDELAKVTDINSIFSAYLELLDLYLKRHFLPANYEEMDFETIKSRFYDLIVHLTPKENSTQVTFSLPPGYAYSKDLEYLCRRLNERGIEFYPGKKVKFSL